MSALKELAVKVTQLYEQTVSNAVEFQELRRSTNKSLSEFQRVLQLLTEKIERIERETTKREMDLSSAIEGLKFRFDAVSEKALHEAVRSVAIELVREAIKSEIKALPVDNRDVSNDKGQGTDAEKTDPDALPPKKG